MAQEIHETTDRARGGETPHIVRYILGISLFLAAGIMTIVWVSGALTSDNGAGGISTAEPASSSIEMSQPVTDGTQGSPVAQENQKSTVSTEN
ncbi:MAG: hypothetical protein R3E04_03900 [Sphingobium sp.]